MNDARCVRRNPTDSRPCHGASQTCGAVGLASAITPATVAPTPAASASHGASAGFVNGGGFKIASRDVAAMNAPPAIATIRVARGRRPSRNQSVRETTETTATSIDHRASSAHAPANPEPELNRVQGSNVVPAATASSAPATRSAGDRTARRRQGFGVAAAVCTPRISGMHSAPSTLPRTGTAHSTQSGRPQTSQAATIVRDGWFAHRSPLLSVRSSGGMAAAYVAGLAHPNAW